MLSSLIACLRRWASRLANDVVTVYLAGRDRRTPRLARLVALVVAAYALSPIDLIPDFVPVLGYLDDLILLPIGIMLVLRLLPPELLAELRAEAHRRGRLPHSRWAGAAIVAVWVAGTALVGCWLQQWLRCVP